MSSAVEIDIRSKAYGATEILRNVAVSIEAGETLALLGPSGIGKTTLLRIACGLDDRFEGSVRRPERIALVFQEPTLLPWRSARRNVTLMTRVSDDQADRTMSAVGLAGKGDLYPGQLSLGQQRRLSLARAFASRPDFLVMDEPFASLDPAKAVEMVALTRALAAETGVTILLVTHSQEEADALANRVVRLAGTPATIA